MTAWGGGGPQAVTREEVLHSAQVTRALLPDRSGEQHRVRGPDPVQRHRLRDADQRREAAGVVTDAGSLEPRPAPPHRHIYVGSEHRIEMRAQDDRPSHFPSPSVRPVQPPVHVPDFVHQHVPQSDLPEQLGDARAAARFGSRGRGQSAQLGLARQRHLVGALQVRPRGAHAVVPEQAGDHAVHDDSD